MVDRENDDRRTGSPITSVGSRSWFRAHRRTALVGIFVLILVLIAGATGIVLEQRSGGTPGPAWQRVGLQGTLVHATALGAGGTPTFAATHGGIYHRDSHGAWKLVLRSNEVWDLVLLPGGQTAVAAENSGTVAITHDAGAHWRRTFLAAGGVFAVTAQPRHSRVLLAGADTGFFLSTDAGLHWRRTFRLRNGAGDAFFWVPGSDQTVYAGTVSGGPLSSQQVYVSRDAGRSWRVYGHGLHSTGGVMSVIATPAGSVLAGTMGNAAWAAGSGASAWHKTAIGMPPTEDHVASMAVEPGVPTHVIAATLGHGLFITTAGSGRWRDVSGSLRNAIVLSVVYSPSQRTVYAGTDQGLYAIPIARLLRNK